MDVISFLRGALSFVASGFILFLVSYLGMPEFATYNLDNYIAQFVLFSLLVFFAGGCTVAVALVPKFRKQIADCKKDCSQLRTDLKNTESNLSTATEHNISLERQRMGFQAEIARLKENREKQEAEQKRIKEEKQVERKRIETFKLESMSTKLFVYFMLKYGHRDEPDEGWKTIAERGTYANAERRDGIVRFTPKEWVSSLMEEHPELLDCVRELFDDKLDVDSFIEGLSENETTTLLSFLKGDGSIWLYSDEDPPEGATSLLNRGLVEHRYVADGKEVLLTLEENVFSAIQNHEGELRHHISEIRQMDAGL